MNKRIRHKIFNRALTKIMTSKALTLLETKVWKKIVKANVVPHMLEEKIEGIEELLASYISESDKKGHSYVPGDEDIAYGEEIQTLKLKLEILKSLYNSMKSQRRYSMYQFKNIGDVNE